MLRPSSRQADHEGRYEVNTAGFRLLMRIAALFGFAISCPIN
jgi:hypothetical protein